MVKTYFKNLRKSNTLQDDDFENEMTAIDTANYATADNLVVDT
jgi:hypothetical protein